MNKKLCIDLDHTLIYSDILLEQLASIARSKPWIFLLLPFWIIGGKARFKDKVNQHASIDFSLLPYNHDLIAFLKSERQNGAELILVTANNIEPATALAEHLNLFDDIIASNQKYNLSASKKLKAIEERLGADPFCYVGHSHKDIVIWRHAEAAVLVTDSERLQRKVQRITPVSCIFSPGNRFLVAFIKAIRVHQWSKNLLLFVSLFMAHEANNLSLLYDTFLGFIAFSLCASSVYLTNDLLDIEADRHHKTKRKRPFAAGLLPLSWGFILAPTLLVLAALIALSLPVIFIGVLGVYYITTLAYSLALKTYAIIDCITLAILYTLRIIAGSLIMSAIPTFWLIAFSMFIFMSLAVAKRYSELIGISNNRTNTKLKRRGYSTSDMDTLKVLGISSGFMAILVLALYINSAKIAQLYTYPELVWLLCPALLYWISRLWLLTSRGGLKEDPLVFALSDKNSYFIAFFTVLTLWLAT